MSKPTLVFPLSLSVFTPVQRRVKTFSKRFELRRGVLLWQPNHDCRSHLSPVTLLNDLLLRLTFRFLFCFRLQKGDDHLLAKFYREDSKLQQTVMRLLVIPPDQQNSDEAKSLSQRMRRLQGNVMNLIMQVVQEALPDTYDRRDFRAKYTEEVVTDNINGALWHAAEVRQVKISLYKTNTQFIHFTSDQTSPLSQHHIKETERNPELNGLCYCQLFTVVVLVPQGDDSGLESKLASCFSVFLDDSKVQ